MINIEFVFHGEIFTSFVNHQFSPYIMFIFSRFILYEMKYTFFSLIVIGFVLDSDAILQNILKLLQNCFPVKEIKYLLINLFHGKIKFQNSKISHFGPVV